MATKPTYSAYLFSWVPDPERWNWEDLRNFRKRWRKNPDLTEDWSCGGSKSIPINTRFYVVKQGEPPHGIFAAGRTASRSELRNGRYSNDVAFDTFLDPKLDGVLPSERLHDLSKTIWHNQMSGVGLTPEIAVRLEKRWQTFLTRHRIKPRRIPFRLPVEPLVLSTKEGRRRLAMHYVRERDPRIIRAKKELVFAENGCLACEVCGFDFCETYGDLGVGVCDCHHETAISQGVRKTRLEDLHIVCPNCHRTIHQGARMLTIAELRRVIRGRRTSRSSK